ncbi:benzoate/H(+) symporter BenE family transporter [Halotalea alkalilenta]|uniref:Benzoate transporter n=1 Tax=Halotalea alkalilenta TaxID=376489 RepID=A0A172YCH7_9GAMM|nr:benzoate/H(+) symporter BenE family transporter [Halotalea alkalilenta]ANF56705.1 hypothetical protein A5892_03850 [Halotalea alkalilenta]
MSTADSTAARPRLADLSLSAMIAGLVAVLVGYTSSAAIILQAAAALGATPAQAQSWLIALGLGTGALCLALSLRYRAPLLFAWSTPGAALIATLPAGSTLAAATGAFLFSALLILICGVTGLFARVVERIPRALAAAMLAGVLVRFGLELFTSLSLAPTLVTAMLLAYLLAKRMAPRYAVLAALVIGIAVASLEGSLHFEHMQASFAWPSPVWPRFEFAALLGIGVPLFVVTMVSQNLPGTAVLRQHGYTTPVSPLISASGAMTLLLAPFGVFALNLAAITAAICAGPEAHEDPRRRYMAAVCAGLVYLLAGLCGAMIVGLFAAFPQALVMAIAGIALLGTLGSSLADALGAPAHREAALVVFLVTASSLELFGIGSAFWGLVIGALWLALARRRRGITS